MILVCNKHRIVEKMKVVSDRKILEIGVGAGRIALPLAQNNPNAEITGVDLQKNMLAKARKKAPSNLHLVQGDILKVDFPRESFDLIYMITVLGEIPQRQLVLEKVFALLSPEGRLFITEVIPDPCYITSNTLIKMCTRAGFRLIEKTTNYLSYSATFVKMEP